ncbi:MAG TPA: acyl carrier protein [Candidatus Didemnitutus sp.]|jgi:acyl carrier protein
MQPASPSAPKLPTPADREEALRHLPEDAREAFAKFQSTGDPTVLDPVILAILADFIPRKSAHPLQDAPGTSRLMEDLGFDSLAITEVVFFTEDLFGISIANEEIIQVRTLDDLRSFVHRKVSAPTAG